MSVGFFDQASRVVNIHSINANRAVMWYTYNLKSLNHVDRFRDVSEPFANGGSRKGSIYMGKYSCPGI